MRSRPAGSRQTPASCSSWSRPWAPPRPARSPWPRTRTRGFVSASTVLVAAVAAVAPPVAQVSATGVGADALRAVLAHPFAKRWGAPARERLLARIGELFEREADQRLAAVTEQGV